MTITIEINEVSRNLLKVHPSCTTPKTTLERKMSDKLFAAFVAVLQVEGASDRVNSAEMAAGGKTKDLGCVALEWDQYAKTYDSMAPDQREQLMQAYYAGALGMFNLTNALTRLPMEEATHRLEALRQETVEFLRQAVVGIETRARQNN